MIKILKRCSSTVGSISALSNRLPANITLQMPQSFTSQNPILSFFRSGNIRQSIRFNAYFMILCIFFETPIVELLATKTKQNALFKRFRSRAFMKLAHLCTYVILQMSKNRSLISTVPSTTCDHIFYKSHGSYAIGQSHTSSLLRRLPTSYQQQNFQVTDQCCSRAPKYFCYCLYAPPLRISYRIVSYNEREAKPNDANLK